MNAIDLQKEEVTRTMSELADCEKVLKMMITKAKTAQEILGADVKDICGYDDRLEMNSAEFGQWCKTVDGQCALTTGKIGPRATDTINIHAINPPATHHLQNGDEKPTDLNSMCMKPRKKCQHVGWENLHFQAYFGARQQLKGELERCRRKEERILDEAETRVAEKEYNEENTTEHMDLDC